MAVLMYIILLLLLVASATLGWEPVGKAAITQEMYETLDEKLKDGGYNNIKQEAFKNSIVHFYPVSTTNITAMVERLAKRIDEIRSYLLSEDLTLVNSTHGVRVCCKNKFNLEEDKTLKIMVSRQETCVVRNGESAHRIDNWTIKKMPTDIRYIVTVASVKTGETIIFPSTDICHSQLVSNRLESTELMKTRPKDVVIILDMSRTMHQSTFKDSKKTWLDAQHLMLRKIFDILSERDRVIVVATQSGRKFTTHNKTSCQSNTLDKVYNEIIKSFEILEHNISHWDNTNSDLSALINHMVEVFADFPTLQHKRDKIAVLFVASKNVSEENNVDTWIEHPFLNRINLISVCVGNIPSSNRPYTTDAVIKGHLKNYGSYIGVSSMNVAVDSADWFKRSILPTGTIISSTGLFPGIGPVLKMCSRKEESFVCLLVPVADIYSAVKLSRYIKSYWILLDEFCRVLIHPKSSYRSGKMSDDLPLYEFQLRINMSEPGCKITSEQLHKKEVNSTCQKIKDTNLTLCLIVKEHDKQIELYPKGSEKEESRNSLMKEEECLYNTVILSSSSTVTTNSDSMYLEPATVIDDRIISPAKLELKNNVRSLHILKDSIDNPDGALSTFVGFIDGVFIMNPGTSHLHPLDYTTKQWFQLARQNPNQIIVLPPFLALPSVDRPIIWSNPTITIARAIMMERLTHIYEEGETSHHLFGVFGMVFDFDTFKTVFERVLSKICSSVQKRSRCFIIDQDGFIIYPQKVNLLHYHREKLHITVQEPDVAEFLYNSGILQKSYCTKLNWKTPTWKVGPIDGLKTFGKGKIYSINQTNLYVVEVDRLEGWTDLQCDCLNYPSGNDLCSCGIQLKFDPCENTEGSLPEICPPAHPDRFKSVEIKPISQTHLKNMKRCWFLACTELTHAGERTCLENNCHWCKVNHTGIVSYVCSQDQPCPIPKTGSTEVATTHPSEKYIWIGIAVATAIILLLCVIVVCHIRTCLREKKKDDPEDYGISPAVSISPSESISNCRAPRSWVQPYNGNHCSNRTSHTCSCNSHHSCRHTCSCSSRISTPTEEIHGYHDTLRGSQFCQQCHEHGMMYV